MKPKQFDNIDKSEVRKKMLNEIEEAEARMSLTERTIFTNIPMRYKQMKLRAMSGELSPKKTIHLNCVHCMGWSLQRVQDCTQNMCSFYAYRPKDKNK